MWDNVVCWSAPPHQAHQAATSELEASTKECNKLRTLLERATSDAKRDADMSSKRFTDQLASHEKWVESLKEQLAEAKAAARRSEGELAASASLVATKSAAALQAQEELDASRKERSHLQDRLAALAEVRGHLCARLRMLVCFSLRRPSPVRRQVQHSWSIEFCGSE